jgi:hypothetical protein
MSPSLVFLSAPESPPRRFEAAVARALETLGYRPCEAGPGALEVVFLLSESGALRSSLPASTARALAAHVAGLLSRSVRLFVATQPDPDACEVDVDDRLVKPGGVDGPLAPSVARDLEREHGDGWAEVCDHKPYALLVALGEVVRDSWAPAAVPHSRWYAGPVSTGDRALDLLLAKARSAARAVLTVVDGRPCLVTEPFGGGRELSFLSEATAERLRVHLTR